MALPDVIAVVVYASRIPAVARDPRACRERREAERQVVRGRRDQRVHSSMSFRRASVAVVPG